MSSNNQQCMITIIYLSVNKLMERSHKKLVQHMVFMQTVPSVFCPTNALSIMLRANLLENPTDNPPNGAYCPAM
jgi:hypothetical protein